MGFAIRRTETIKFGDFMTKEYKTKGKERKAPQAEIPANLKTVAKVGATIPIIGHLTSKGSIAMAHGTESIPANSDIVAIPVGAISDTIKEKIVHAFDPLVDLMVALSVPIAGVMITGGALMIMIGMKERGYNLILSSSLGYVLVQLSPMLIELLIGVGNAV